MNDDPHSDLVDLEARLRAWRPAELPTALHARLRSACPPRRLARRTVRALAGALAMAVGLAWLAARFVAPSGSGDPSGFGPDGSPVRGRTPEPDPFAETRWMLSESLTMNIGTGVPPGVMPAAWRLDGPAELSDLILVRSADGKLPLKVDCQF